MHRRRPSKPSAAPPILSRNPRATVWKDLSTISHPRALEDIFLSLFTSIRYIISSFFLSCFIFFLFFLFVYVFPVFPMTCFLPISTEYFKTDKAPYRSRNGALAVTTYAPFCFLSSSLEPTCANPSWLTTLQRRSLCTRYKLECTL